MKIVKMRVGKVLDLTTNELLYKPVGGIKPVHT